MSYGGSQFQGSTSSSRQGTTAITARPVTPPTAASRQADALRMPAPSNNDVLFAPIGSASQRAHRPVSAMPNPPQATRAGQDPSMMAGNPYDPRRASAHPTIPTSSQTVQGLAQMAVAPSGVDPSLASSAISSGIPITSSAALSYFAAHPKRQQVHFGNYLLLQTLGEGEFGKVKLGVHKEWGEEVAVKLIKRDRVASNGQLNINGPPKDPTKISKVEREIQVLKEVRHPNIVRLYEVIESDRYIGIVLEYASGGELFDFILAHRYLKSKDACRLFAQLISGVNYLHEKKIVHRDLKLENLLLDRNRNVIITDFGFANNFGQKDNDLMATSCGSPCYAAPELVVQDGLYNGSAVDVWSCGVILYAMLSGYLPWDDDANNPEGDNINLLYKYIMKTSLAFPDYIEAEPRDLLNKMLVPDPTKRIDLEGVMNHSWLAPYRELFKFTVEDLERAAIEQQSKKRQVYRQHMAQQAAMAAQQQQQQQQQASQGGMPAGAGDFPSSSVSMASGLGATQAAKAQRHQSAMAAPPMMTRESSTGSELPTHTTSVFQQSLPASASQPLTALNRNVDTAAAAESSRRETRAKRDRDEGDVSETLAGEDMESFKKGPAANKPQRHTVQIEFAGDSAAAQHRKKTQAERGSKAASPKAVKKISVPRMAASTSASELDRSSVPPTEIPAVPLLVPEAEKATTAASSAQEVARAPLPPIAAPQEQQAAVASGPSVVTAQSTEAGESNHLQQSTDAEVPFPQPSESRSPLDSDLVLISRRESSKKGSSRPPPSSAAPAALSGSRVERAPSVRDKTFFGRLLGTNINGQPSRSDNVSTSSSNSNNTLAAGSAQESTAGGNRSGSNRRKAMSLVVGRTNSQAARDRDRGAAANRADAADDKQRSRRQSAVPNKQGGSLPITPGRSPSTAQTTIDPIRRADAASASTSGATAASVGSRQTAAPSPRVNQLPSAMNGTTNGPSSSAAKRVMDWFRKKSLNRPIDESAPPTPTSATGGSMRRQPTAASSSTPSEATVEAPRVTVTGVEDGATAGDPSSRSTSGAYSNISHSTDATGLTSATEASYLPGATKPVAGPSTSSPSDEQQQQATPRASTNVMSSRPASSSRQGEVRPFNESAIRYHLGAVDQSALFSAPPPTVFADVCRALAEMGIDVRKERDEEFKLECVRRRKPNKSLIASTTGLGMQLRSSVFPPTQAEYEKRTNARLSASPSSSGGAGLSGPGGMANSQSTSIRNLLLRRGSQASPTLGNVGLPSDGDVTATGSASTIYGEPRLDGGGEVRFSVEVSKNAMLTALSDVD